MPENRQRWTNNSSSARDRASPAESNAKAGNGRWTPAHRVIGNGLDGRAASTGKGKGTGREAQSLAGSGAERGRRAGSSFEARFGRVILQHGIAAIPSALFYYQGEIGLKAQHVWFVSYILSHKWDDDLPYPSLSNMARCSGVSLRNIQFIKSDLCRADMLQVSDRYNSKGGRDSNAYDFSGLFAHLEDLIAHDAAQPNKIGADLPAMEVDVLAEANTGDVDPSFVARFGRVIARRGVAAVPRAIFTHQKALALTPQQIWFISYIFSFQWSTTLPYPSINKMVQHTGYSRAHLHTIKAELVDAGYLRLVHRTNEQGGQDSNAYDFSGLLEAIRSQLQPAEPPAQPYTSEPEQQQPRGRDLFSPRRGQSAARRRMNTHSQPDTHEAAQTGAYESQHTAPYEKEQTGIYELEQMPGYETEQTPDCEAPKTGPVRLTSYRPANGRRPGTMKHDGHESEPLKVEANEKKDDSNRRSQKRKNIADESKHQAQDYSPYIAAVITDFSNELNDPEHVISNVTQALRLWKRSALKETVFTVLLYEAKRLTRQYQGKQGLGTITNKMSYFFVVLRQLTNEAD